MSDATERLTSQEVFDRVVARLRDGTGQAVNVHGACSYLTETGLKCAVGIFIPDGHPAQQSNCRPWGLRDEFRDLRAGVIGKHTNLLGGLQFVHDGHDRWNGTQLSASGERALKRVADENGLKYSAPATSPTP